MNPVQHTLSLHRTAAHTIHEVGRLDQNRLDRTRRKEKAGK
jgi:hypothetical protein